MSKNRSDSTPSLTARDLWLKRVTSRIYRSKVKTFVEAIKGLRGLKRIPNAGQRPKDPKKQDAFDKAFAVTMDKATVHALLESAEYEETRRMRSPSERLVDSAKSAMPKDSLRY